MLLHSRFLFSSRVVQIGNPGLTLTEQKSQMSAWSIIAAPLLISSDLTSGLDNATLAILSAPEVIAVHRDTLAVQVRSPLVVAFDSLLLTLCRTIFVLFELSGRPRISGIADWAGMLGSSPRRRLSCGPSL
jgi:hypothetical protein